MDDGLEETPNTLSVFALIVVLILVVMDDGLEAPEGQVLFLKDGRLNPCCNG